MNGISESKQMGDDGERSVRIVEVGTRRKSMIGQIPVKKKKEVGTKDNSREKLFLSCLRGRRCSSEDRNKEVM
jgi:hypothetical protein